MQLIRLKTRATNPRNLQNVQNFVRYIYKKLQYFSTAMHYGVPE